VPRRLDVSIYSISKGKHAPKILKNIQRQGPVYVQDKPEIWDEMAEKLGFPSLETRKEKEGNLVIY